MTTTTTAAPAPASQRLEHFPVSFFATVMGTAGLAIAWHKAHLVLGAPVVVGEAILYLATALFAVLLLLYAAKWLRHPGAVMQEARHPVRINFFASISIGLLLLAIGWSGGEPGFARALWAAGTLLHLAFTLMAMSSWIHHSHYEIKHANPAWFIPVVGNIIVPLVGVRFAPLELSWFFFSIGIVFWPVLLSIILYRLFFHPALPERLTPTLFILLAPPAVGCLAWMALTGQVDAFARILFYCSLFLLLLLGVGAMRFLRAPFYLSSWAYSFPLAAVTIVTLAMAEALHADVLRALAAALLGLVSIVVAALVARTVVAAMRGEICVPE
ncbi:MAG: SLAC1 anion channel family protein [Betaproteobacteria bacterium]|nr:SLAC1 anion channel family protein [Betaproteobacteria bacterium]MBK7794390.1 SLAC1 anion channel family protein [Betaproteobacteria bacterium]MBK9703333.1 SLAC1 anion channel family protein [Betaproteobacteria bacterium]MBL0291031.1 SLAC1 anion channel family protein [Betaproteobacteria bacterium]